MKEEKDDLWRGLDPALAKRIGTRDYESASLPEQLGTTGLEAGVLLAAGREKFDEVWIPGVEIFPRRIYRQPFRGSFGEFARRDEGILSEIKLWPAQWSAARMFGHTAKGFHVHPPFVPTGESAADYFARQFKTAPAAERPYSKEQWDVMFFVTGRLEMILRDLRAGMGKRTMRFSIDGDNYRSANNVGVVIPPGVAHALRVEGSEDAIMVYGTSTSFRPEFEGRIGSEVESAELPEEWRQFLGM
ncbi:MAG: hypothetical protein ABI839_00170 [Verrucomicrobiota bacterium]